MYSKGVPLKDNNLTKPVALCDLGKTFDTAPVIFKANHNDARSLLKYLTFFNRLLLKVWGLHRVFLLVCARCHIHFIALMSKYNTVFR